MHSKMACDMLEPSYISSTQNAFNAICTVFTRFSEKEDRSIVYDQCLHFARLRESTKAHYFECVYFCARAKLQHQKHTKEESVREREKDDKTHKSELCESEPHTVKMI